MDGELVRKCHGQNALYSTVSGFHVGNLFSHQQLSLLPLNVRDIFFLHSVIVACIDHWYEKFVMSLNKWKAKFVITNHRPDSSKRILCDGRNLSVGLMLCQPVTSLSWLSHQIVVKNSGWAQEKHSFCKLWQGELPFIGDVICCRQFINNWKNLGANTS